MLLNGLFKTGVISDRYGIALAWIALAAGS